MLLSNPQQHLTLSKPQSNLPDDKEVGSGACLYIFNPIEGLTDGLKPGGDTSCFWHHRSISCYTSTYARVGVMAGLTGRDVASLIDVLFRPTSSIGVGGKERGMVRCSAGRDGDTGMPSNRSPAMPETH